MNTVALAGVATYLFNMTAIGVVEPDTLAVGITTIAGVNSKFTIIDKIGTSYTGGPVLNLSEWEINVEGISDIQLAFNAEGVLDVATVKADIEYLPELLETLKCQLSQAPDTDSAGLQNMIFLAGTTEVVVETHPLDTKFTVNYISAEFRDARNHAQDSYA